ncbi:lectin-like [Babylonia areolata]|uniref:lectin-like n=1 Tax=Babylonia areolata TaxID=304850 RepID=UPI003FD63131
MVTFLPAEEPSDYGRCQLFWNYPVSTSSQSYPGARTYGVRGVTDGFVWLGADDLAEEGKFVWDDGTTLPQDSPLWRENEPSGLTGEHCVSLDVQEGRYFDHHCGVTTHRAVCQADI